MMQDPALLIKVFPFRGAITYRCSCYQARVIHVLHVHKKLLNILN